MSDALKFLEKENGPTTLGMLFRAYRTRNDLTQDQVADLLGIGKSLVSDIENGRKTLSLGKCVEYAKKLGESVLVFTKVWLEQSLREEKVEVTVEVKPIATSRVREPARVPLYRNGVVYPAQRMAASKKATKKIAHGTRKKVYARKAS